MDVPSTEEENALSNESLLQYTYEYGYGGGIGTVAKELNSIFAKTFGNTSIYCGYTTDIRKLDGEIDYDLRERIPAVVRLNSHLKTLLCLAYFYWRIAKTLREQKLESNLIFSHAGGINADIIVAHSCHLAAVRQKLAAKKLSWILNPLHYLVLARELTTYRLGNFKKVVCISRSESKILSQLYKVPPEKIAIIPNGVDLQKFTPISNTKKLGLASQLNLKRNLPIILFVGNEFDRKGLRIAIDALACAQTKSVNFQLVVVGRANKTPYEKYARELGVSEYCTFIGHRTDIPELMSTADITLVLSDYEPFGLVGIESIACGTPIVSTRIGGMLDYVQENVNGVFCERTGQGVLSAVTECLNKLPKSAVMEGNIRSTVSHYSWSEIGRQYLRLAQSLIRTK